MKGTLLCIGLAALLGVGSASWWAMPRKDVAAPPASATPAQVVETLVEARNARDFQTSNALNTTFQDGRLDRIESMQQFKITSVEEDGPGRIWVRFSYTNGDAPQRWGYVLERNDNGAWRVVDSGLA